MVLELWVAGLPGQCADSRGVAKMQSGCYAQLCICAELTAVWAGGQACHGDPVNHPVSGHLGSPLAMTDIF